MLEDERQIYSSAHKSKIKTHFTIVMMFVMHQNGTNDLMGNINVTKISDILQWMRKEYSI